MSEFEAMKVVYSENGEVSAGRFSSVPIYIWLIWDNKYRKKIWAVETVDKRSKMQFFENAIFLRMYPCNVGLHPPTGKIN